MYEECPIKYENGQAFIDYINAHRHLLSGRPRTYQHGDYHIGNMMIGNDKQLYIIDFTVGLLPPFSAAARADRVFLGLNIFKRPSVIPSGVSSNTRHIPINDISIDKNL